jgi:hypothetical protein
MDEIAVIAADYFDRYKSHAPVMIDDQISLAVGSSRWSDVLKWHRVKHRLQRLQMTRQAMRAATAH